MAKKRGNSEGSIYKMADGRWRAAIVTGKDANGKLLRKTFTRSTKHEVAELLNKAIHDQGRGINIAPERRTLGHFLDSWLVGIKSDKAPGSYVCYENVVRTHIKPMLGSILLEKLRAEHIEEFKKAKLAQIMTKGRGIKKGEDGRLMSTRSVQYALAVLRCALNRAVKLDLVPRNVAKLVDPPKVESSEIMPYTPEQAQAFLAAARLHPRGALFSCALALGLRKGEALALKWSAIDFEQSTLAVRQTVQRVTLPGQKGRLIFKEPKRRSKRVLNMPPVVASELLAWRSRQEQQRRLAGSRWREGDFVFTTSVGTPIEPRHVSRFFDKIVSNAGLPRIRVHDLRHTCATLLLAKGVHPRVVMELMGHSKIAMTMDTYSHVIPALRKDAADTMEAVLAPVATSVATLDNRANTIIN